MLRHARLTKRLERSRRQRQPNGDRKGREIFRHDTFGSEAFWGGALRLHQAIAGKVDLDDVGNTIVLLQADAVVGIKGVLANIRLTSIDITCAFCHSTVDDSLALGSGRTTSTAR